MAGVSGLEPEPKVLETSMLTIDTIPLKLVESGEWRVIKLFTLHSPLFTLNSLFVFFVNRVATATTAKLFEFETLRCRLFILGRNVVAFFALGAL